MSPLSRVDQLEGAATRRRHVLRMIREDVATRGYPPTVGELAERTGVSKVLIRRDLAALVDEHKIEKDPGVTRGIRLA